MNINSNLMDSKGIYVTELAIWATTTIPARQADVETFNISAAAMICVMSKSIGPGAMAHHPRLIWSPGGGDPRQGT